METGNPSEKNEAGETPVEKPRVVESGLSLGENGYVAIVGEDEREFVNG